MRKGGSRRGGMDFNRKIWGLLYDFMTLPCPVLVGKMEERLASQMQRKWQA